jgi:type I restriction enzyme S subunit
MKFEPFENIFKDSTSNFTKVKKEDYKSVGLYPIVDQGQEFIGGYTDDEELVVKENLPVIIFGDHTKIFKYVDFPLTIGADGVKVLTLKNKKDNALFYYYFLKSIKIVDKGYSRHFKYLKEKKLPVADYTTQLHIANVLSKAENLIAQRKESIRLLDEFLKSTFLEMFGDPVRNSKGWEKVCLGEVCRKIGSGSTPRGGKESYHKEGISLIRSLNVHNDEFVYKDLAFIDDKQAYELRNVIIEENDVLLNITGASVARCCIVPKEILPARVNQHVAILRPDKNVLNPLFLSRMFTSENYQSKLVKDAKSKGATREAITKEELELMKVIAPSIELQTEFARIVEKTEALKTQYQQSLTELENLYGSLSQKAFKGELTSIKNHVHP